MNGLVLWGLVFIIFLIIEICTVSLISIWFCIGAAIAIIAYLCHLHFFVQLSLFLLVSFVCMGIIMPIVKEKISKKRTLTNADSLIGKAAIVTEQINGLENTGRIMVNGNDWMARSDNPSKSILVGTNVIVTKIEGAKLIVKQEEIKKRR